MKVKILEIDQSTIHSKSKWEAGGEVSLQIEPHGSLGMAKDRLALVINAHKKFHEISFPEGCVLTDERLVLQDIEGLTNGATIFLKCCVPPEPELPPVVLSEDEGLCEDEETALPNVDMPSADVVSKELSDEEMDRQGALKGESADALEDGDLAKAIAKFNEAMMIGGVTAMMVAKRGEMLLKQKRWKAAVADATLALSLNPDSAKAYRVRGKAYRFLGNYEGSTADFAQAQKIDYDEGVADMHKYVEKRWQNIQLQAKQNAKAAAKAA